MSLDNMPLVDRASEGWRRIYTSHEPERICSVRLRPLHPAHARDAWFFQVELSGAVNGKAVWPSNLKPIAWHRDSEMVRMKLGLYHSIHNVADGEVEYKNISIEGPKGIIRTSPAPSDDEPDDDDQTCTVDPKTVRAGGLKKALVRRCYYSLGTPSERMIASSARCESTHQVNFGHSSRCSLSSSSGEWWAYLSTPRDPLCHTPSVLPVSVTVFVATRWRPFACTFFATNHLIRVNASERISPASRLRATRSTGTVYLDQTHWRRSIREAESSPPAPKRPNLSPAPGQPASGHLDVVISLR